MPLRRPYAKSHHGCGQCKQRRIKCDELHPICSPCRRKNIQFSFYGDDKPQRPPRKPEEPSYHAISGLNGGSQLPMLDLELLNHWHAATVDTLLHQESTREVLRTFVLQEALSLSFLMHILLAMSALHLSHYGLVECRQLYTEVAMTHNNTALPLYLPLLSQVTPDNCHALFAFSCFVPMFSFATHGPNIESKAQSMSGVIEVFKLIRGAAFVVSQARPWIEKGGMCGLLTVERMRGNTSIKLHATTIYSLLHELHAKQQQECDLELQQTRDPALEHATESLLSVLQLCADTDKAAVLLRWAALVKSKFLDALTQDEPISLVLLGYFGAAIDFIIDNWWMEGWGRYLVNLASDRLGTGLGQQLAWARDA
ncbi:Zn(II)2Cys6 transcription factor domain-containing protein [Aspergillus homomorphus CBS 101889]|uniref:Zn(2)-C6 fungal-type domain-containing protein n=1 Tax=Aspergillus homomorphus (strain CBS 101889) TaxID=1450537 RepID=A0A395HFM8_ASPHC|nr:hypothetical protein BO97DRAFT_358199 [Aspergillus homomorphus CBS 101889]RAL06702.1 hypothetical protein BO97DRAFT_358199 [Aspergillus homomorphus CBS 101889]